MAKKKSLHPMSLTASVCGTVWMHVDGDRKRGKTNANINNKRLLDASYGRGIHTTARSSKKKYQQEVSISPSNSLIDLGIRYKDSRSKHIF